MSVENLETYYNHNGFPIIRRCKNCVFWKPETVDDKAGFCVQKPYHFAFTLEANLFAVTRDFFLCEHHKFVNESKLAAVSEKVLLKNILKKKDELE